jgi:hypothetical protein
LVVSPLTYLEQENLGGEARVDEKAIMGFVVWLFLCVGLVTFYTVPERAGWACLGNIIGLAVLVWVLRRPRIRERLARPELLSLLLLLGLLLAGVILAVGLGQLAQWGQ